MAAYYNEIDPYAAQWLRNLIGAGHIAPGDVDDRSIVDVRADDLKGYAQCHFFAGIGGWSLALRLAGWGDDRSVWTGSCPCQPFSAAGKGGGFDDERHLWPEFHRLIAGRRPPVVFGEQVASKPGLEWLDVVSADLENAGYAVGAADLCAAGVGAPHIRQRLWWVAEKMEHAAGDGRLERRPEPGGRGAVGGCAVGGVGHTDHPRPQVRRHGPDEFALPQGRQDAERFAGLPGVSGRLADAECGAAERYGHEMDDSTGGVQSSSRQQRVRDDARDGFTIDDRRRSSDNPWRDADWLYCRDGKWRPVEPGTFPLAHGIPARVGRLRAYGNAIVPQVAAAFIRAYQECSELKGTAIS